MIHSVCSRSCNVANLRGLVPSSALRFLTWIAAPALTFVNANKENEGALKPRRSRERELVHEMHLQQLTLTSMQMNQYEQKISLQTVSAPASRGGRVRTEEPGCEKGVQ